MIQLKISDKRSAKKVNEFLIIVNELASLKKFMSIEVNLKKFEWNPRNAFEMEKDEEGKNFYFYESFEKDFNEEIEKEKEKDFFNCLYVDHSEKYLKGLLTLGLAVRQEERNDYISHDDIRKVNNLFFEELCLIDSKITFEEVQEFNSKYI